MSDTPAGFADDPGVLAAQPRLSLVIPCYNSEATLGEQLSALAGQTTRYSWEVLVADNGSRDKTIGIATAFRDRIPNLRIVDATARRGAAFARNAGARAARGTALLFCDADDVMGAGYLESMGRALDQHQFVACRYDFQKLNASWLAAARGGAGQGQGQGLAGGYCHPTLPYAGAGGLGIAKPVHEAVNGFDMTLKAMAGQEDTDYCIRVQLVGTPLVFVPDAVMHVRFRETVSGVFTQAWAWAESGAHVQRRYAPGSQSASFPRTAYDLGRHLVWKLIRVRSKADIAQWIWLAGWCGGLLSARRTLRSSVSDRPVRCAVVIQTPKDPQSAVYIGYQSLASALQDLGHSVELVSPADFPVLSGMSGRWVPLAYPFAIARWLQRRRDDFDLVMFHSYSGWLATTITRGQPRSLVMFHGVEPLYHCELREETARDGRELSWRYRLLQEMVMPVMLRIACRSATGVACLNRAEAAYVSARNWAPRSDPEVLAHGVPPQFFLPLRTPRPLQTILFVGQWLPMKGIRYLREAATALLRANPAMALVCAGTLLSEAAVQSEFPQELRDRVAVFSRVDQSTLARLYRDADVFVFPSLYEGFSRAIVEAMASRLPIVCTAVGVAADALRHEESALIVPKRSAAAMIAAIERLRDDPQLAARLANAAGERAGDYTLADVTRQTIRVIMNAAGRSQ